MIPLAYIVEWIIYFILSLVNADPSRQPPQPYQPGEVDNLLQRLLAQSVPPEVLATLKALGAALLLSMALLVIARAAARWRSSSADAEDAGEERDSLWEPDRFKRALLAWLRALFRRRLAVQADHSNQVATSAARAGRDGGRASIADHHAARAPAVVATAL